MASRVRAAWLDHSAERTREAAVALEGRALLSDFLSLGGYYDEVHASVAFDELTPPERLRVAAYVFEWPEAAKRFGILWRDSLLEWERASVLHREGNASGAEVEALGERIAGQLEQAARHWDDAFRRRLAELERDGTRRAQQLYRWSLQTSPWPTYAEQLTELQGQMSRLHDDYAVRMAAAATLKRLNELISGIPARIERFRANLRGAADAAIAHIGEAAQGQAARVSTSRLESLDPGAGLLDLVQDVTERANGIVDELPERVMLYVRGEGGRLQYRDLNLERQTGQWLSAEVMPDLQRAGRTLDQLAAELSRTLTDVRNRVLLARERGNGLEDAPPGAAATLDHRDDAAADGGGPPQEPTDRVTDELEALREPLRRYLRSLETRGNEAAAAARHAAERAADELRMSRVYDPRVGFLELSFGAGLSQVRQTQDALFGRLAEWVRAQRERLDYLRDRLAEEERLSEGERIVRAIRSRQPRADNAAYTGVLITRGFIGEAFHSGRQTQIARAERAVEAHREGFRGAVAITGQRYAGKTHLAELLAGRHFEQRTVRLHPGGTFELAGRTFRPEHDLGAALAFVRKHSFGRRLLVLIDDLELWASAEHPLAANAAALKQALDELSGRLFFIVTMGNWTLHRLSDGIGLASAFQVEVNVDTMRQSAFVETLTTRHAATHLRAVDADGNELSDSALRARAEEVYRAAAGNVGDGLRRWAAAAHREGAASVRLDEPKQYGLPNFLDADLASVLTAVKRRRYINERDLRRAFGPAFDGRFRPLVQRLIRLEVLIRHRTGTLAVNPVISNEIARLLEREGHLVANYSEIPLQL